jgi:hypothetical protein
MQTPVDWRAAARRMRARSMGAAEIAAALDKEPSEVREVLRGRRRTRRPSPAVLGAGRAELPEPHIPRIPRVTLDRTVLQAAALAFAKGEISRAELMRRIAAPS